MPFWSSKKSVDPVCGMEVEEKKAAATYDYEGKRYYFCAVACKNAFQEEPMKYLKAAAPSGGMAHSSHEPHKQEDAHRQGGGAHGCH